VPYWGTVNDDLRGDPGGPLASVAASFTPGSRIAGYRLEQQIGAGGMAVVFRAVDERLGRRVALKLLAPALSADEAFRQRFIRESRAAAAVDDPHIIPVYEAGEADGVLFIAMRYVPGGDVRTLVSRRGPMPVARIGAIIFSVASALDAAHAAGLIHRDVKPGNMLVDIRPDRPDHVYLSDFGLSKGAMSSSGLTGTGQFLGTVDYCAPEQIEGRPADGRADQYALACAAFELLAGSAPFRREQATATIWAHMSEPPPRLTGLRPDLPPAVDQVFGRALAKAPAYRYASCREFADALCRALAVVPYPPGPGNGPGIYPPTQVSGPPSAHLPSPSPGPSVSPASARLPSALVPPGPAAPAARPGAPAARPGVPAAPSPPGPSGYGPPRAAPGAPGTPRPAGGGPVMPPNMVGAPRPGATYPQQNARSGAGRAAWRQDWTNWALMLAFPVVVVGVFIAIPGGSAVPVGGFVILIGFAAVPAALIAKMVRWLRRQMR
jgi:serine/threonine protein kinase